MKQHFTTVFVALIFLSSIKLNGQISKGDFMLSINGAISHDKYEPDIPTGGLGISYLKMITDKLMLGGGTRFSNGVRSDFDAISGETSFYPYHTFRISPQVRYYFSNKKLATFAVINNESFIRKFKDSNFEKDLWGTITYAGVGVDYFLSKNVAIESILNMNIINVGSYKDNPVSLLWNTSLKLFLNPGFTKEVSSLASKVLKAGNFTTSAIFLYQRPLDKRFFRYIKLSPNIEYFITDRIKIHLGTNYSNYKTDNNKNQTVAVTLGFKYYQKIFGNFFSSIGFGINPFYQIDKFGENTSIIRRFSSSANFAFHYFKKQKRFFTGVNYSFTKNSSLTTSGVTNSLKGLNIFAGVDYYVSDDFYLRTKFDFSEFMFDSRPDYSKGGLSFGLGYFFNSKKIKF